MKNAENITHRRSKREERKIYFKLQVLVNEMAHGSCISPAQLAWL